MLQLDEVKNYMKVDIDEDDSLIVRMIESAYSYAKGAIDDFDEKYKNALFKSKAETLMLFIISEWYDNRQYSRYEKYNEVSHIVTALIQQLQLEEVEDNTNEN